MQRITDHPNLLTAILDQLYNAVMITDADLDAPGPRIVYVNPAFERMTGYSFDEVKGKNPRIFQGPETDQNLLAELRRRLAAGLPFEGRTVNYRKDGTPYHVEWNISPLRDANGDTSQFLSIQHDRSELAALHKRLEHEADTDYLTGLNNRARGEELLEQQQHLALRYGQAWSVAMADIDNFKAVNDRFGHTIGDEILVQTAHCLRAALRDADTPIRWGGEEFLLILPYADREAAQHAASRIHQQLATYQHPEAGAVTLSIGLATYRPPELSGTLVERADDALYRAKHNGRNRTESETLPEPCSMTA